LDEVGDSCVRVDQRFVPRQCKLDEGEWAMAPLIQQEVASREDLSAYRGSWVAIRDGRVIDSALDPIELRGRKKVHKGDKIILVPSEFASTLVL
jgi:hypothetical protein